MPSNKTKWKTQKIFMLMDIVFIINKTIAISCDK